LRILAVTHIGLKSIYYGLGYGLDDCGIDTIITIPEIIHRPAFYLKYDLKAEFCLHLQVEPLSHASNKRQSDG
jgi:hypothetical protein